MSQVNETDLRQSLAQSLRDLERTSEQLNQVRERLLNIASHYERLLNDLRTANALPKERTFTISDLERALASVGALDSMKTKAADYRHSSTADTTELVT